MNVDLLDYDIIVKATSGNADAINEVLKHFDSYMNKLSLRQFTAPDGSIYLRVNEDIKRELQIELITKLPLFNCTD